MLTIEKRRDRRQRAGYFPNVSVSGQYGFSAQALNQLFNAAYDASVANYRQTVLTAFQQVEDNIVALRVLDTE
jgi:outer membrane protein TolC